jgi:V/A-type H+/Na+-transporting ATPase subunit I
MKSRMKKLNVLCSTAEKTSVLDQLGKFRVIHVAGPKEEYPIPEEVAEEMNTLNRIEESIENSVNKVGCQTTDNSLDVSFDPELFKKRVDEIEQRIENLSNTKEALRRHNQNLAPWRNIHWLKLGVLEQFGVNLRFFTLPEKEYKTLEKPRNETYEVNRDGGLVYFVVFEHGERFNIVADEVHLPKKSLTIVRKELEEAEEDILKSWKELASMEIFLKDLGRKRMALTRKAQYKIASEKMEAVEEGGPIQHLFGWFPADQEDKLKKKLDKKSLTYRISDPEIGDNVPVHLENKKYPSWFEDITKLYQLPNYNEFDLTPFIGFFYPIFFAYCLGDAGYGMVLTILSLIGLKTFFKTYKGPAYLGLVLGVTTMVIGTVKSGTFFGISLLEAQNIPFLSYLTPLVFITDDQDFIFNAFNVSLMVGLFQILVGVIISITRRVKYMSPKMALPQVGKLLIIISAVSLFLGGYQNMAPFSSLQDLSTWTIIIGIFIMIFFYDLNLPIGQRIGSGSLGVFFVFTGLLGDILSYIRLFALGVSSSILGLVVNQIGAPMFEGGWAMMIAGVLFLILGHGLNFVIALLGSMIHPLRLTFVEFYNNAQFEGGGVEYEPFKK